MSDERHVEGLRLPKRQGLHSSHSQTQPQTQVRTHSALKIHGGESNEVCLEWFWRQHYGDDPFGNIIKHIPNFNIWSTQRCVNLSVPRTTVCTVRDLIVASWRNETKYTASTHGNELEEGNKEEKKPPKIRWHDEGICTDFVLIWKKYNYNRWPDQHFTANRKQPAVLRPKTLFFKHSSISLLFWAVLILCSV